MCVSDRSLHPPQSLQLDSRPHSLARLMQFLFYYVLLLWRAVLLECRFTLRILLAATRVVFLLSGAILCRS